MPARRDAARELADLDAVVAALDHPSRRHVLVVLRASGGSMTAGEVADRFSCTWPTTSRHVKRLVEAGLIAVERRGRRRVYRLDASRLGVLERWVAWFRPRPARQRRPA
jgi:DNA-binding transcriptional ArsR family regulator